ncbi:hypothetical protein D0466_04945 [Peribacillus glennii]|uniref:Uncharacterized protein n=1 Tax=Peribacillus glennii TaxID=2303991 RepID=A0A372LG26_9BACI|nr:hypothetical protein D0466_04945 [Peribacillus glennii]
MTAKVSLSLELRPIKPMEIFHVMTTLFQDVPDATPLYGRKLIKFQLFHTTIVFILECFIPDFFLQFYKVYKSSMATFNKSQTCPPFFQSGKFSKGLALHFSLPYFKCLFRKGFFIIDLPPLSSQNLLM